MIPKPGKDLSLPDKYRPIALLNSDYKIFTKILANRLCHLMPRLIHKDQVGLVPARHAGDNTRRTIDLTDLLNKMTRQALILSLDAQKAFDRISWPFIFATLSTFVSVGLSWQLYSLYIPDLLPKFNYPPTYRHPSP